MTTPSVTFDGVWKKFRRGERHDSLRELVPSMFKRAFRSRTDQDLTKGEFWALRNVSFEVKPGEALGIIGPNGAGKSTTLKLLTRILRPTRGTSDVKGRLGALIEVAAGFHPDLTGRENVFLQGAIMGMPRAETLRKFEDIVDFSGISAFIDTPVKRYSSGMSARLGFSIAVHLDPDVLIVDEVLAVGDMAFQKRAFDRMKEILSRDIALIVVSHQLERVSELCDRALLLRGGEVQLEGTPAACIGAYLTSSLSGRVPGTPLVAVLENEEPLPPVAPGEDVTIRLLVRAETTYDRERHFLTFRVRSAESGATVTVTGNDPLGFFPSPGSVWQTDLSLTMNVGRGLYILDVYMWEQVEQEERDLGVSVAIHVESSDRLIGTAFINPRLRVASRPSAAVS